MLPDPSLLTDWHAKRQQHFARTADDLERECRRFIEDWAGPQEVRLETISAPRIKSPERIWSKLQRKLATGAALELSAWDQILGDNSPIGDLVGVRIVVRGLRDTEKLLGIMSANDFLAEDPFSLSEPDNNKILRPSKTGYRAIHLNGHHLSTVRSENHHIPFEVQLKTSLQDSWGSFTHDIAYANTTVHGDSTFERLRELQRLLADSLDVADQLNRTVEDIYEDFLLSRPSIAADDLQAISLDGVLAILRPFTSETISIEGASRVLDAARFFDISTLAELSNILEDQDAVDSMAEVIESETDSRPSLVDVVIRLIRDRGDGLNT